MGKSKRKKFRQQKPRPTGLQSMKECTEEEELGLAGPSNKIDTTYSQAVAILERVQSVSKEERECACATLANLAEDQNALSALFDLGIIKSLAPLLLDEAPFINETAAGALRNMSVHGGEICKRMIEDDVLTSVTAFLQKHLSEILMRRRDMDEKTRSKQDPHLNTLLQIVHLLLNLCESDSKAVSIVNRHSVVSLLVQCMQAQHHSMDLAVASAQCLNTVTEDNPEAAMLLCQTESQSALEVVLLNAGQTMRHRQLMVYSAGILFNIKNSLPSSNQNQTLHAIVKVLAEVLNVQAQDLIRDLLPQLQELGNILELASSSKPETQLKQLPASLEESICEADAILSAQQVALEIISNMCCPDDDNTEELDASSSSSDDILDDMAELGGEPAAPLMSPLCLSAEIHGIVTRHELPTKVLDKTEFPDKELLESLVLHKEGKSLFRGLLRIQSRALLCLQNIISTMDVESLGGSEALTVLLEKLLSLAMREPAPTGEEFLEGLTSAIRAVMQKMALEKIPPKDLSEDHLQRLSSFGNNCSADGIKVNLVGIMGSLGNLLATQQGSEQVLTAVGIQLVEVATKDQSLWVIAEALDAIFDTFGDGQMADVVADTIQLVAKLKTITPKLKTKVRQSKNTESEHLPIINNARSNLNRFIKYKESQKR